jgi:paraquat-inducible protein A
MASLSVKWEKNHHVAGRVSVTIEERGSKDDARMVACHECGLLLRAHRAAEGYAARCPRCGAGLYAKSRRSIDYAIALHFTGLVLFVVANAFPFITFKMEGREQTSTLISGVLAFIEQELWLLAVVVFLVTIAIPLIKLLSTLYVLVPVRLGHRPPKAAVLFRYVELLHPWAMMEVFLLGVIVAYVKLTDLATLDLGPSLFAFAALIIVLAAGEAAIEPREIWNALGPDHGGRRPENLSGGQRQPEFVDCHSCGFVLFGARPDHHAPCPRCDASLHHRKPNSLTRTWALLITAAVLYIPANVFPVMTVISFGKGTPDTILSGVEELIHADMWPLAVLVFFASITVPVMKILGLTFLLITVGRGSDWRPRDRTLLFRVIEAVGRWSMIDVFMISILIALVKLGNLATIEPGIGATSFAGVVIITMIASHSFDPRLIWDRMEIVHGRA